MLLKAELFSGEILEYSIAKTSFIIGRSSSCDVVMPIDGVSRQHVKVELSHGDLFITDVGSANGVLINNKKIPVGLETKYQTFFHLSFGPVKNLQIIFEKTVIMAAPSEMMKNNDSQKPRDTPVSVPLKKKGPLPKSKKDEPSVGTTVINFIAVAIIFALFYYAYSRMLGDAVAPPPTTKQVPTKADYF